VGPQLTLGIWVAGGGYTQEIGAGNLQEHLSARPMLEWNNFDFGGCDGQPEPLSGGRTLLVCGDGTADYNDTSLVAQVPAEVFITANGERRLTCSGIHQFTFTRVTP
jgi:hypothetical protein